MAKGKWLFLVFLFSTLASSWNILSGYAGQISLGHTAFFGDGIAIFKQMAELDFTPKFSFFVRAPDAPTWGKELGPVGDYVTLGSGWHNAMKYPGVDKLNEEFQALAGRQTPWSGQPMPPCRSWPTLFNGPARWIETKSVRPSPRPTWKR